MGMDAMRCPEGEGAARFRRGGKGFTLIEMVIVIAITGVIATALIVFFKPAVDAYFDARNRAALTDTADTALRRMARDIRAAVSNSIRIPNNQCFELLPSSTGGRYRMAPDTINAGSAAIDTSTQTTAFDVLSPLSAVPSSGDWVVIGNQNTNDVYTGVNRAQVTGVTTPDASLGTRRISIASTQFPSAYDGGRFTIVANSGGSPAVFYVCAGADGKVDARGNGNGTLYRVTRTFDSIYPSACPAVNGAAVLASNVRYCNFVYDPNQGSTQQSGFVWMELGLTQGNETVTLSFGAHVDNVP